MSGDAAVRRFVRQRRWVVSVYGWDAAALAPRRHVTAALRRMLELHLSAQQIESARAQMRWHRRAMIRARARRHRDRRGW
jgi:hypothetical protein